MRASKSLTEQQDRLIPQATALANTSMQQLFSVMTAVQISLEILLNQMRESSVYYYLVIDSDKCWTGSDVSVMKKLPAKLSIMFPLIKLPVEPQPKVCLKGKKRARETEKEIENDGMDVRMLILIAEPWVRKWG